MGSHPHSYSVHQWIFIRVDFLAWSLHCSSPSFDGLDLQQRREELVCDGFDPLDIWLVLDPMASGKFASNRILLRPAHHGFYCHILRGDRDVVVGTKDVGTLSLCPDRSGALVGVVNYLDLALSDMAHPVVLLQTMLYKNEIWRNARLDF